MSEQKPVAWVGQNPRDGGIELCQFKPAPSVLLDFNMKPLYAHPAPDVVRQLVEAAKRAMNYAENVVMAEGVYFDHDDDLPFIESALAAAKETGI